jgi:hypothetical protein
MKKLRSLFEELETRVPDWNKQAVDISASSVGWHIAHTSLAASRIISALQKSDPDNYRRRFNWKRSLVFFINTIPRGKGKAPQSVLPGNEIDAVSLQQSIVKTKNKFDELMKLGSDHHFEHPYLGQLNVDSTIRFLTIHTKHHLKIIDDIRKAAH